MRHPCPSRRARGPSAHPVSWPLRNRLSPPTPALCSPGLVGRERTVIPADFKTLGTPEQNPAKAYIPEKDKHGQTKPKPTPRRFQKDPEHRAACVGPS